MKVSITHERYSMAENVDYFDSENGREAARKRQEREEVGKDRFSLIGRAKRLLDFLQEEIEPPEMVLPFLPFPGLIMIFGRRGCGKSWVLAKLALCLAAGRRFLHWEPKRPLRVLLIDGEMPRAYVQWRLRQLLGTVDADLPLRILTLAELKTPEGDAINLAMEDHRTMVLEELRSIVGLDEGVDCMILDNVSSLFVGLKENDNDSWAPINRWLMQLREIALTVVLVHHAGKSGTDGGPRGASSIDGALDTTISLDSDEDAPHLRATWKFEKERHMKTLPKKFTLELMGDDNVLDFTVSGYVAPRTKRVCQAIARHGPSTTNEIVGYLEGEYKRASIKCGLADAKKKGLAYQAAKGQPYNLTADGEDAARRG